MPAPIIINTQSVLGYLQHETFSFQPAALNTPTGWTSSALPAGLTLNATTGLISGAVTNAGVYSLLLIATNASGASAPVMFTFGIEASFADTGANVIDLTIDLASREVSGFFAVKRGDDLVFRLHYTKGGVPNAIALTAAKVALKEFEGEPILVQSTTFHDEGAGVYLIYMPFVGPALDSALSEHEDDTQAVFSGLWEIEWLATSSLSVGPGSLRGSSRTFPGNVVRDLIP